MCYWVTQTLLVSIEEVNPPCFHEYGSHATARTIDSRYQAVAYSRINYSFTTLMLPRTMAATLDTHLSRQAHEDPLPPLSKSNILKAFWRCKGTSPPTVRNDRECYAWDAYFRHYTTECRKAIERDHGEHVTIRTHQDIVSVIRQFEEGQTKDMIKRFLMSLDTQQRSDEVKIRMAEGSIRLVARLFLMVDVGAPPPYKTWGGSSFLPWNDSNADLKSVLADHFVVSSMDTRNAVFKEDFTAFNLQRFTGFEIKWTSNLADHLRLIDNDRKLCIFHHATFLQHQQRYVFKRHGSTGTNRSSDMFPKDFINETLRTLDLLFPRQDSCTQKWLRSQQLQDDDTARPDVSLLDRELMMSTDRCAANFDYWRDELMSLKEKFDEPEPTSISQFWHDRRNRPQWYTFWIAVTVLCLTIFFGLVQSIEGALQVYKAYHPASR